MNKRVGKSKYRFAVRFFTNIERSLGVSLINFSFLLSILNWIALRCCSYVGRRGGKQNLSLGIGCIRHGIIVHELGHTIGFWHEQNRPDRGSFIDILYNNVESGKQINFDLVDEAEVETLDQVNKRSVLLLCRSLKVQ